MVFGDRLRALRVMRHLSQTEFGKHVGLATSTVSGYESGTRMPDLEKLKEIADFFGVSTDYLLDRTPSLNKSEEEFLVDLGELTLDELRHKYRFVIDKVEMSEEELIGAISWIKTNRAMKKEIKEIKEIKEKNDKK